MGLLLAVLVLSASGADIDEQEVGAACEVAGPLGPVGSPARDRARLAELLGAAPVRPGLFVRASSQRELVLCRGRAPHPSTVEAAPADFELAPGLAWSRAFWRSGYPEDANDGALWKGRGLTFAASASAELRWGPLSAAVAPVVAWTENREFSRERATAAELSPYANPFYNGHIDLPLRHGASDFVTLDAGESYVRLDHWNLAVGVANESLWWGPGVRNAVLFTNTAPGLPHAFVGTSRPVDVWVGWLDVQLLWGLPRESAYFNGDAGDDRRLLSALALSFEPAFAPGLFLGLGRLYHFSGTGSASDWFRPLVSAFLKEELATEENPSGNDEANQLASVMARWVLPAARLELYGELGRDDHSWDMLDLLMEPTHSAAYVVGLQHLMPVGGRWGRLTLEAAHTDQRILNRPWRPDPRFYTHFQVRQGHTHEGQLLGAAIGPAADSQYLAFDVLDPAGGSAGAFLERTLRNESWYAEHIGTMSGHDLEIAAGVRQQLEVRGLEIDWEVAVARRWNAYFRRDRWNVAMSLGATWGPGARAAALPGP